MAIKRFRFIKSSSKYSSSVVGHNYSGYAGKTKPIKYQSFKGPSHFIDSKGRKYVTFKPDSPRFDSRYHVYDPKYIKSDGSLDYFKLRNNQKYKGRVNEFPEYAGMPSLLMAADHLMLIANTRIKEHALMFEVDMAKIAERRFKDSFLSQKFRTRGAEPWPKLSPYTIKNRRRFHTNPNKKLVDTGTLRNSIRALDGQGVVITDPKAFQNSRRHKGFCYAGVHNAGIINRYNPRTGSRIGVIPQRQFMGHSSYLRKDGWAVFKLHLFNELFTPI